MDLNRHQFLFLGIMVLLLGLQVRMVQSYVLTEKATGYLAKHSPSQSSAQQVASSLGGAGLGLTRKVLSPPDWLGWCLLSVGAVVVLHSLAMPRPS